ncbi:hypothetical protein [Allosphingosinicella sp.]|uniref:hypothetical protein n=1 Tax=Allosphingosinicella sp. TaxID=2823234 RepID=UPI002EF46DE6
MAVGPGAAFPGQSSAKEATPPLTPPPQGEGNWEKALAAYRSAEGAVEAAGRVCSAAPRDAIGAAEDAFGDRLEEMYEALRRLLVRPAPDLAAFLLKVDAAFEHEIATLAGGEPCVAAIRGDLRRLGSVFTPRTDDRVDPGSSPG